MKQGSGISTRSAGKTEPVSKAVSPRAVEQLGTLRAGPNTPLYEGRGLKAPMVGATSHGSGSQGKHK